MGKEQWLFGSWKFFLNRKGEKKKVNGLGFKMKTIRFWVCICSQMRNWGFTVTVWFFLPQSERERSK